MTTSTRMLRGLAGVAVSTGAHAARPLAPPWQQTREVMERFVELFYRRRQVRAAFESCVAGAGFQDHDPSRPSGRHAAMESLARMLTNPHWQAEVLAVLVDGDMGVVHAAVGAGDALQRRVDLFRLAGGRIVEHWSYGEATASAAPPQAESRTTS